MKILSEIAKDVLVGHPLIKSISFSDNQISFVMTDDYTITIDNIGAYTVRDGYERMVENGPTRSVTRKRAELDDDIPF